MRARCLRHTHGDYYNYGARGISICKRWDRFENFLADMGEAPPGMSLDRINNNGGYKPSNCRWATPMQQTLNSSRINMVTINGETKCVAHWAISLGLSPSTLNQHMKRCGLTPKQEVEWRLNK